MNELVRLIADAFLEDPYGLGLLHTLSVMATMAHLRPALPKHKMAYLRPKLQKMKWHTCAQRCQNIKWLTWGHACHLTHKWSTLPFGSIGWCLGFHGEILAM